VRLTSTPTVIVVGLTPMSDAGLGAVDDPAADLAAAEAGGATVCGGPDTRVPHAAASSAPETSPTSGRLLRRTPYLPS
jgi:hypothetical protein